MKCSVAFKGLPFEPEERQVIYVENEYDERINTVIRDNYDQLRWIFKRSSLDFVYLPMFFNDEETKEKVLYYAPYLTTEIMEKTELRSSYLLEYMSHLDNRTKILPSLLFSPKKEADEWLFQGQTIEFNGNERIEIIQWLEDVAAEIEEELIPDEVPKSMKPHVQNDEDEYDGILYSCDEDWNDDWDNEEPRIEYSSTPELWKKIAHDLKKFSRKCVEEEVDARISSESSKASLDEIREEDVRDTVEDLERNIERLRLLGIPLSAIVEFVSKYETISRLRLTDDLRILLPDYNNREVKMGALYKAVYFLFLNHPEGIVLQQIENFHHELVNYYLQTSQREELTHRMRETINRIEYPGDNTINIVLSRIKAYFKATIDEHLAKHYFIIGSPGEPYKIALDNILIEWENEV